jgi:hypothetical protein
MVTPILTYDDIETPAGAGKKSFGRPERRATRQEAAGSTSTSARQGHTPQSLRNLANIMASHEELLSKALKLDEGRLGRYCRPVDPDSSKP